MTEYIFRDIIDCFVKVWSILWFSSNMGKREGKWGWKISSLLLFSVFVLLQRYVLNTQTLSEAFLRNILLYLLTCNLMLAWRQGQRQYLVFLASIVFFLWGGWLKLFSPTVFSSLHLPTFGYGMAEGFPLLPVTLAENLCRVLVIVLMKKYVFDISSDRQLTTKEAFLALVPAIIDHTTVLILYYLTIIAPSAQVTQISLYMTLLTLMLVFGMPCMLAATEQRFQLQRKEVVLIHMEHQMKQQVKAFESRQLTDAQVHSIYHDLSKQLSVLEKLKTSSPADGAVDDYLEELRSQARSATMSIHTGNAVLDALLSQKEAECRAKGIALTCMVDFKQAAFIRYADIVTMFANAVDNAIEAASALPEERRRIGLSAGTINGQLIVKCTNPYEGQRKRAQNGLFETSKEDALLHGIGLSNLKRIVESYQGVLYADDADGIFVTQWMIPVPVEAEK